MKKILEEIEAEIKKKENETKKKENAQYSARTLSQYYLNDFMGHSAVKRQATDAWDGLSKYNEVKE